MKTIIFKLSFSALLAFSVVSFMGCGGEENSGNNNQTEQTDNHDGHAHDGHEHNVDPKTSNSKYVCPMYCEGSAKEEAGKCPVCGMDLVLRADLKKEGE